MNVVIPPPLRTSEPESFARDTLARRVPAILASTRAHLPVEPPPVAAALDALDGELRGGRLRGLRERAPDRAFWDHAAAPHVGRSWLDLPWFFAETYFYRRVVEATGYFGDGELAGIDPYAADKAGEWAPDEGPRRCAEMLAAAPDEPAPRLRALLHASVWGNRADLSYNVARHLGSFAGDAATDLLVDDAPAVAGWLGTPGRRLIMVADNAGTELLMDLALCDHLLHAVHAARVDLHVKNHPFFVSDAMAADVDAGEQALRGAGGTALVALADRIAAARRAGRLAVTTHPFYTSHLFYPALPHDLRAALAAADLVILKGDANYRRLCSDARWPTETPFADAVAYFPAPLVALRTMKSEVLTGLPPGRARVLAAEDPRWMVNGQRAVVQARL